jgi:hypothetical protein
MNRISASYLTMTFALCTFAWTGTGESSNPQLLATELPLNIVQDCGTRDVCQGSPNEFISRWVSHVADGNLFMVRRASCSGDDCGAWLIEKTERGLITRLMVDKGFQMLVASGGRDNLNSYPDIQAHRHVSENETTYTRYSWTGDRYVQTETRNVYRVGGVECGNREECYQAAMQAHREKHTDQALKIWESVHGLSWI